MQSLKKKIKQGFKSNFRVHDDGLLIFRGRLCNPNYNDLKKPTLEKAHNSRMAIDLGSTKTYQNLRS